MVHRQSNALPTLQPSARKRFAFYGNAWMEYELEGLPADYRQPNDYEQMRIKFRTDSPNGLLWYIGNRHRATHLSLKVRRRHLVSLQCGQPWLPW